jgi:hypothetical protein
MDRRNQTDSPLGLCPCGCGIPLANKKGISYKGIPEKQLARHFDGMRKTAYHRRKKARKDKKARYAFACETASYTVDNPALKKDLLEIAAYLRK